MDIYQHYGLADGHLSTLELCLSDKKELVRQGCKQRSNYVELNRDAQVNTISLVSDSFVCVGILRRKKINVVKIAEITKTRNVICICHSRNIK